MEIIVREDEDGRHRLYTRSPQEPTGPVNDSGMAESIRLSPTSSTPAKLQQKPLPPSKTVAAGIKDRHNNELAALKE